MRNTKMLLALLVGVALTLSACGAQDGSSRPAEAEKAIISGTVTVNGKRVKAKVGLNALDVGQPRGEDVPSVAVPDGNFRLLAKPGEYRLSVSVVVVYFPKPPFIDVEGGRPCGAVAEPYDTNVFNLPNSITGNKVDSVQASADVPVLKVGAGKQTTVNVEFDCEGKIAPPPSP
jgi:hypothetical protein